MQAQQVAGEKIFAECYYLGTVARMTARERFLFRVHSTLEERNLNQKDLKGANSEGWISNKLRGQRDLKLNEAEQIADALQVPLAELLRKPEDSVYELDNLEARVVEAYRQLSKPEQDACVLLLTLRHRPAPYATGRKVAIHGGTKPYTGVPHGSSAVSARPAAAALPESVRILVAEFEQRIADAFGGTGGSAPVDRRAVAGPPKHRRSVR